MLRMETALLSWVSVDRDPALECFLPGLGIPGRRIPIGGAGGGCGCCKWPTRDCILTLELGLQEGPSERIHKVCVHP